MSENAIIYEKRDRIAIVRLNRPEVHNAINKEMMETLTNLVDKIYSDQDISIIIIMGVGEKSFCAGGDLKYFTSIKDKRQAAEMSLTMQKILHRFWSGDRVTIAAVNGLAFGGGCEIITACHFKFTVTAATFSFRQAANGIITGWGGSGRLMRLVGRSQALRLLLTATTFSAEEALKIGFIDRIVQPDELLESALKLADEILSKPREVVQAFLALNRELDAHYLSDIIKKEREVFSDLWVKPDFQNWLNNFLNKSDAYK